MDATKIHTEGDWRDIRVGRVMAEGAEGERLGQRASLASCESRKSGGIESHGNGWLVAAARIPGCATGVNAGRNRSSASAPVYRTTLSTTCGLAASKRPPRIATDRQPHPAIGGRFPGDGARAKLVLMVDLEKPAGGWTTAPRCHGSAFSVVRSCRISVDFRKEQSCPEACKGQKVGAAWFVTKPCVVRPEGDQ
jgi:hypothetical protein